ncbi:NUDIX hydrolase [Pyrolobus fumarii 1A]|uniref:NUDIX hydrolase n=1 Tax=Pyrolobus fumarii (strain DSM 11204 / 1A) TaxID=694429 RepID=G0EDR7_PYRF1|nr:NUDIX domain-containing protein [Pyrolobus fumarii]AEM38686.1 NUDIX hydrolase [Pyrolobus fumarii 1A]
MPARHAVLVSTRCIIIRGGRLLVQRGKKGHYRLPGGRVANSETIIQCLKREMLEELALEIDVRKLLYIIEAFYRGRGKIIHEVGFYFECGADGEPEPQESHIEVLWVDLDETSLAPLRPRVLATVLPYDWRRGWDGTPRYLVSFEDDVR